MFSKWISFQNLLQLLNNNLMSCVGFPVLKKYKNFLSHFVNFFAKMNEVQKCENNTKLIA